jgi:hypothetical protein
LAIAGAPENVPTHEINVPADAENKGIAARAAYTQAVRKKF